MRAHAEGFACDKGCGKSGSESECHDEKRFCSGAEPLGKGEAGSDKDDRILENFLARVIESFRCCGRFADGIVDGDAYDDAENRSANDGKEAPQHHGNDGNDSGKEQSGAAREKILFHL